MAVIDLKNTTIRIKDNGANFIDVKIGEGNLTYDEKRNIEYIKDRGELDTVREGDEEPMDVRIDATWEYITGTGGVPTVEDAMKQRGEASDWVSTSADPCEPYAVDIVILYDAPCGESVDETITLPDFRWTSINHDLRGGTLAFTGQSHATQATAVRGAISS